MRLNPGQLDLMQYPALIPLLNCFKSLVKPECYFEFHSAKKKTFEIFDELRLKYINTMYLGLLTHFNSCTWYSRY